MTNRQTNKRELYNAKENKIAHVPDVDQEAADNQNVLHSSCFLKERRNDAGTAWCLDLLLSCWCNSFLPQAVQPRRVNCGAVLFQLHSYIAFIRFERTISVTANSAPTRLYSILKLQCKTFPAAQYPVFNQKQKEHRRKRRPELYL